MATPRRVSSKESEENKRKQNYLRSHGYPNLAVDGSWDPWLEQAWIKATTREKLYPVSPWGLILRGWDNLTGNTTYRVDHPEGEIRPAPVKNNASLAGVAAIGLRDPRAAVAAVPLTIGSALWLGNGPEIMQSVSEAGIGLKEGAQRIYNRLASYFYPEEAPDPASNENTNTGASAQPASGGTTSSNTNTANPSSQADQSNTSGGSSAPSNPDPNNKKGFKEKLKQVLNNIKRGYGNALTGLEYGVGFGAPIAGLGYGIYKWAQPNKTRADSILDSLLYLVGELNKAVLINENLKKIDAILQLISNGVPQSQSNDSNYFAPQLVVNPTDTLDF